MEYPFPDDADESLDDLRDALADSSFSGMVFGSLSDQSPGILQVRAVLDLEGFPPAKVDYWKDSADVGWFSFEGAAYRVSGDELKELRLVDLPAETSNDDKLLLNRIAEELRGIHGLALQFLEGGYSVVRAAVFEALDSLAEEILADQDEDDEEPLEQWEEFLQEFTHQCRMGLFRGLSVDESPDLTGAVNISAFVLDLDANEPIELKVYWQSEPDADAPAHWLAVGNTTVQESDEGAESVYDELLADHEGESREHLQHCVLHLHELAHLATDIIMMRANRPYELFAEAQLDEHPSDAAMEAMAATEVSDALAGLNGIARLYTGSRPFGSSDRRGPEA